MRTWRSLAGAGLAALAGAAGAAAPPLAVSVLAALARTPPVSTPFVQVTYNGVLSRPLVVSGTLKWLGGDHLERDVTTPFRARATLDAHEVSVQRGTGEVRRLPLSEVPQAAAMLVGFRALLGGDVAAVEQHFTLASAGNPAHWVLTLTPRSGALQQQLAAIVIDGRGNEPRCLTITDANGDASITMVGALARAGLRSAAPLQSAVAARCRNES